MSDQVVLVLSAFLTSIISGFMGMAGGILLLTIMALYFPPATLIPLHGIVQFASNGSRAVLLRKFISLPLLIPFLLGSVIGALIGSQLVVAIPEVWYRVGLGSFILILTWLPKLKSVPKLKGKFFFLGGFATFLSLFVGATGPLIAPFFIREKLKKEVLVASKAACQLVVHTLKVAVFFSVGFSLVPYWELLVAMVIAVFIGNYLGKKILFRVNEVVFMWLFKGIISVLAIRMVILGLGQVTFS